jgi:hypothetical protein
MQFKGKRTLLHRVTTKNAVQRRGNFITKRNNKKCSSKERGPYYTEKQKYAVQRNGDLIIQRKKTKNAVQRKGDLIRKRNNKKCSSKEEGFVLHERIF